MFKRHDGNCHQNPPRVFGPGSDLRERVEQQDIIIEEMMNIMATYMPEEGRVAAEKLRERYEESRRTLHRHQAMKILDGQGEHASLEHYIHRFTTPDPIDNEPYPFPNPNSSIYNLLSELIGKYITRVHRELQLKGAGRRKLEDDTSITDCDSDIYTDADGSLVLILAGNGVVGKWRVTPWVSLIQHAPAQTFFKRSHMEELMGALFNLLSTKYDVDFDGDEPLTVSYLVNELSNHLPNQFSPSKKSTYIQPKEFRNLRLAPMRGIETEFDNLADGCPLLRTRLDPSTHGVDHVFMFRIRDEGYVSYSASEGLTFWYYSSTEGLWTGIHNYLPYIPLDVFQEALDTFYKSHGYEPRGHVDLVKVEGLASDIAERKTPQVIQLGDLKGVDSTGYYKVTLDDRNEPLHLVHVELPSTRKRLFVFVDEDKGTLDEAHVLDVETGKRHGWDELNPQLQQCFLRVLDTI